MRVEDRIKGAVALGKSILDTVIFDEELLHRCYLHNNWFTAANTKRMLHHIAENYLDKDNLLSWIANYTIPSTLEVKRIGIVAAGNIPLVCFHDILCSLILNHHVVIKLSEKDTILTTHILNKWSEIDSSISNNIHIVSKLEQIDAIIATGSNNTARYFEYYFGKYPHIIRKNRNSIAVLTGKESKKELELLGNDVFDFFGLGCRNVSKLYLPEHYDFSKLIEALQPFNTIMEHTKYMNNLDYQRTIYLMNNVAYQPIDFINIVEHTSICSPIACLHYEYYKDELTIREQIAIEADAIQCIIGHNYTAFGTSQQPILNEYADNIDTLKFLLKL